MAHKELANRENELAMFDPTRDLRTGFSGLIEDFFAGLPAVKLSVLPKAWAPRVDIKESEKEYVIKAALPGCKKEDVKISVENGMLTLSGERKEEHEEKGKTFLRHEMMCGQFMRSFTLPTSMHPEDVKAKFADGVLTVTLPKPPEAKSRGINVKVE